MSWKKIKYSPTIVNVILQDLEILHCQAGTWQTLLQSSALLLILHLHRGFKYWRTPFFIHSVQFSCSVMSDSLRPPGLQHARPPCPSPTPWIYPNSCPLSRWCHPTISSPAVPFSCLQSFPESGSFPMSQLFTQVARVLEFQLPHQSFQWTPRTDLLWDGLVGSPCSPRDS